MLCSIKLPDRLSDILWSCSNIAILDKTQAGCLGLVRHSETLCRAATASFQLRLAGVHKTRFTIESMCKVFKVSRSGYYQFLNRVTSPRSIENIKLLKEIKIIYEASKKTYGSPRVTAELKSRGFQVSRPKVARMRRRGISFFLKFLS